MKTRCWLHCYGQRSLGREYYLMANTVNRQSPAAFLLHLVTEFPEEDNLLYWSVEITKVEFKKLEGQL